MGGEGEGCRCALHCANRRGHCYSSSLASSDSKVRIPTTVSMPCYKLLLPTISQLAGRFEVLIDLD